jgi:hypothetical protein
MGGVLRWGGADRATGIGCSQNVFLVQGRPRLNLVLPSTVRALYYS